jgi:hypothetical protein
VSPVWTIRPDAVSIALIGSQGFSSGVIPVSTQARHWVYSNRKVQRILGKHGAAGQSIPRSRFGVKPPKRFDGDGNTADGLG